MRSIRTESAGPRLGSSQSVARAGARHSRWASIPGVPSSGSAVYGALHDVGPNFVNEREVSSMDHTRRTPGRRFAPAVR